MKKVILRDNKNIKSKRVKYHHLGMPTKEKLPNERYLPHLKMYVSDHHQSAYGVEWVRYDDDADFPELVNTVAHVAFEVDDVLEAIEGKNVIIEPNSPSPGVLVAFIEDNGAPIEFLQVDRSIAEDGI